MLNENLEVTLSSRRRTWCQVFEILQKKILGTKCTIFKNSPSTKNWLSSAASFDATSPRVAQPKQADTQYTW